MAIGTPVPMATPKPTVTPTRQMYGPSEVVHISTQLVRLEGFSFHKYYFGAIFTITKGGTENTMVDSSINFYARGKFGR
jgi:hypothetical protein